MIRGTNSTSKPKRSKQSSFPATGIFHVECFEATAYRRWQNRHRFDDQIHHAPPNFRAAAVDTSRSGGSQAPREPKAFTPVRLAPDEFRVVLQSALTNRRPRKQLCRRRREQSGADGETFAAIRFATN